MNTLEVSRWLWDFYFLATLLLCGELLACLFARQPARRVALAWATAVGLLALAFLTTLPNWSRIALLPPAPLAPALTDNMQPVMGQATPATVETPPVLADELSTISPAPSMQTFIIDWGVIALYALAAGSVVVLCWLGLGAWQVRRLRAAAEPAPKEILELFDQLAQKQGKNIQLGVLLNLPVAVAVGLRKPCILLPQAFVTHSNREQLRSVLAHELAHVEHRDLWLLALLRSLMVLLWPHPLFWFLRRRVRLDQEILADAAAAELTSRGEYAEQLVAFARTATQVRVPRLASSVGLWEKPSQLKERIALLLDEKLTILRSCSRKWRVGTFLALVGIAVSLSLVTLTPAELQVELVEATEGTENREIFAGETLTTAPPEEAVDQQNRDLSSGLPPKLLYLAWQDGTATSDEWGNLTLWNLQGESLDPVKAKAFLQRVGEPLNHQILEKSLHPLLLFFQVDKSIHAPINPMANTPKGKSISIASASSRPTVDLNVAVLTTPSWQVAAWPETVSLKLNYATENIGVIKTIDTVGGQVVEITDGVRWYLDPSKAREFDPKTGRMQAAPGRTAGVLEIRDDIYHGLTSYSARIFVKKRARQPMTAYSTVNTLNGKDFIVEVSDPIDNADQIERVLFLSQRHAVVEIDNVPLRLDLLPKDSNRRYIPITPSDERTIDRDAYENGVFVPDPPVAPF